MRASDTVQNVYAIGRGSQARPTGQKWVYSDLKTFTGSREADLSA